MHQSPIHALSGALPPFSADINQRILVGDIAQFEVRLVLAGDDSIPEDDLVSILHVWILNRAVHDTPPLRPYVCL
jgi:hypothetical protein